MADKNRRVIKAPSFEEDIKKYKTEVSRLDTFIEGAEEALCRDPKLGKPTANTYVRALPMAQIPGNPQLVLYYGHSVTEVYFFYLGVDGDARVKAMIM